MANVVDAAQLTDVDAAQLAEGRAVQLVNEEGQQLAGAGDLGAAHLASIKKLTGWNAFFSLTSCHGGSDNPGRDECGDTKYLVVLGVMIADAEAMVPKTAGNSSDSAGDVFKATTVVAAVVITKDATRADYPGRDEGSDVVKKVMTAGVVVAMVADAVAKSDGAEDIGNYGDSGGQVSYGTGGGAALAMTQDENDGSEDFGNYGDSGCEAGEVTAVVGGSDDPGRDEGSDAALEAITAVDVVAIVAAVTAIRSA
ncbi:hypothetical protein Bbelb_020590 [Branchiostoma belcheri]|nr:hypothetical protein Bbelb_020590 [Branchiostoma belcheri]